VNRRVIVAAALDVLAVVIFVALGRRSHDESTSLLAIAAPFLIALAIGWLATRAWHSPTVLRTGAAVWVITVVCGVLLRRFVFDRGTAASFIVVTTLVLGLFLLGWRAVAALRVPSRHDEHA
jgi:MFS-type transporter involved in bile tolerance (Atg22 family)